MNDSTFTKIINENTSIWNEVHSNKPIIFWGCGNSMHLVKNELKDRGIVPTAYCENNKDMIGKAINGIPILSYEQIKQRYKEYIIVLTVAIGNAIQIMDQLRRSDEKNPIYHVEHPFKVDKEFLEYSYVQEYITEFEQIYDMLEDEKSRKVFAQCISFKMNGNKIPLLDYVDGNTFFDENIIPFSDHYSYVDVGAYTGDTVLRFYAFCRGKYDKIYAIEPDQGNFNALSQVVKYGRIDNAYLYHIGGWDHKDELKFYTIANKNSVNFDSPNFFKEMKDTVFNSMKLSTDDYIKEIIPVDTVDNLLNGHSCGILKINALGADYQVLRGSEKTIRKYKPIIVGEFGAQKEHLLDLLYEILRYNPNYKLIMRQKEIFGDCKTIYYAIDSSIGA